MAEERILRVFPDPDRAEDEQRAQAERSTLVSGRDFLTFAQFVRRLAESLRCALPNAAPLETRLWMRALAQKQTQSPFGAYVEEPAFARAVLELFSDLKSDQFYPDALSKAVEVLPKEKQRPRWLGQLYRRYQERLSQRGIGDWEETLRLVQSALSTSGLPPDFAGISCIEIQAMHDFPPSVCNFILALAHACHRSGVLLRINVPVGGNPGARAAVDPLAFLLERAAQNLSVELDYSDLSDRPLDAAASSLFVENPRRLAAPVPDQQLQIFSVPSAREEARSLARFVRRRVDEGVSPDEVAVCFRNLAQDSDALAEAFEEVGLRVRIRRRIPLASAAIGQWALNLPAMAEDDFPGSRVASLLRRFHPELAVGRILSEASIQNDRVGSDGERGAFDLRLSLLEQRLVRRGQTARVREVQAIARSCKRLLTVVRTIPMHATAAEMFSAWWKAVRDLGLLDSSASAHSILEKVDALSLAGLRAEAKQAGAADALQELAEAFQTAFVDGDVAAQPMSRALFQKWLWDAAEDFSLRPPTLRGACIQLFDVREIPGRTFRVICLGGMTQGRFPKEEVNSPLMSGEDRASIGWKKRQSEDRLLFYAALTAATDEVCLSFATEVGGKEQLPSSFLEELGRISQRKIQAIPRRPVPVLSEIGSPAQGRARLALELLAPQGMRVTEPDSMGLELRSEVENEPWFFQAKALADMEEARLRFFSSEDSPTSRFSGLIENPALRQEIAKRLAFGAEKPANASELERFANCAFKGFLTSVLGLEEEDVRGEEQGARERGSFWHAVLEQLFTQLGSRGLLNRPPEEIPEALWDEVLEESAKKSELRDHVGHPALWKLAKERALSMAKRMLASEHRGLPFGPDSQPVGNEVKFGRPDAEPSWRHVVLDAAEGEQPIHLQGRIDRLDRVENGVAVVDYKSSLGQRSFDALLTTDFQLPIYLYAARQAGHAQASMAAWLSMRDGDMETLSRLVVPHQSLDELLSASLPMRAAATESGKKNLANAVHALVSKLRAGQFPVRPESCDGCGFRSVCRITERRGLGEDA